MEASLTSVLDVPITPEVLAQRDVVQAEVVRRNSRRLAILLGCLWVPLFVFADPILFTRRVDSVIARGTTLVGLVLLYVWLAKRRSLKSVSVASLLGFLQIAFVWGGVVVIARPDSVLLAGMSLVMGWCAAALGIMLPWRSTAIMVFGTLLSMFIGGVVRGLPSNDVYFMMLLCGLLVFAPLTVFVAYSRDRLQLQELAARSALQTANGKLREQDELRSRLFVNLSHDLRTPLTVIGTQVELLRSHHDADDTALDRIDQNVRFLVDLLDQLLELARLDAGRAPHAPAVCDVAAIARSVVQRLPHAGREVSFHAMPAAEPLLSLADPRSVERVITNLVANALRAAGPIGSVEVLVEPTDGGVRLSCRDSGPGIPEELRPRLFERFASFAREGSTASGIGLALARELAERDGGTLRWLEHEPKTTFELVLPRCVSSAEGANATLAETTSARDAGRVPDPPDSPLPSRAAAPLGTRAPILLVEDNADLRASVVALLSEEFDVHAVSGKAEALLALRKATPRAIVSDILLPDGDGYEILRYVRSSPELTHVPVLLVSALAEPNERVRGLGAGADDYIPKPFDAKELRSRVASAVRRSEQGRAALEEERAAWQMELHDGAGGSLARAAVALEHAALTGGLPADRIEQVLAFVRDGIEELRSLLSLSGQGPSSWSTLVDVVERDVIGTCAGTGLVPSFRAEPAGFDAGVPAQVAHATRRIVREAMTNVVKHACATDVACELRFASDTRTIEVRVSDDGRGICESVRSGYGLGIMRRRAAACGGRVTVEARVPRGTVLSATLALDLENPQPTSAAANA